MAPDAISAHDVSVKILRRFRAEHSCPHRKIFFKKGVLCAVWLLGSLAHLVFDARTATPIINQVSPSILYMLRWLSMAGFFPAMLALRSGQFPLWGGGGVFLGVVFDRPIFGVEDWLGQGTSACNQLHPSMLRSVR